jgi:hypothetical protein
MKGFMSIGGKEMMKKGAKVVIGQGGKEIAKGVVRKVSKDQAGKVVSVTLK